MRANPVYKREITVSSRSARLPLMILLFNGILSMVALLNMYASVSQVRMTAEIQYTSFLDLYGFVAGIEFILLLFLMPALTAGSISGERERQTLDLLLSTTTTAGQIVLGKLLASLSSMLLLIVSSFPVLALVFTYGGIRLADIGTLFLLLLTVALFSASIGIFFSALCRKSTIATAASYGTLMALTAGTFVLNWFIVSVARMGADSLTGQSEGSQALINSGGFLYLMLLNPAATFYDVIEAQLGQLGNANGIAYWFGSRADNPVLVYWVLFSLAAQIAASVLLLTVTVRMIDPVAVKNRRMWKRKQKGDGKGDKGVSVIKR